MDNFWLKVKVFYLFLNHYSNIFPYLGGIDLTLKWHFVLLNLVLESSYLSNCYRVVVRDFVIYPNIYFFLPLSKAKPRAKDVFDEYGKTYDAHKSLTF